MYIVHRQRARCKRSAGKCSDRHRIALGRSQVRGEAAGCRLPSWRACVPLACRRRGSDCCGEAAVRAAYAHTLASDRRA